MGQTQTNRENEMTKLMGKAALAALAATFATETLAVEWNV